LNRNSKVALMLARGGVFRYDVLVSHQEADSEGEA